MNRIAVIYVVYKPLKEQSQNLIRQIKDQEIGKKNVLIKDNTHENVGYGKAINKLVRKCFSEFDYYLILNPDVALKKNAVREMVKLMELDSRIGIVGPKIVDEKGKIWSLGGVIDKKRYSAGLVGYGRKNTNVQRISYPDFISGTAMLIRKNVFEKIGLFAEDYFLYYEDVDFCLRAKKAGFLLALAPKAEIVHYASSSVGKNSPLMQYYMSRNHLLFVERFGPLFVKVYEMIRLPKTLFDARSKPYELLGIRDYFFRRFGKYENWG